MHSAKVLVALAMMVVIAESTVITLGVVGGGGLALAGLLGLKALLVGGIVGGALIGAASRRRSHSHRPMRMSRHYSSYRRHGRSVEDEPEYFDEVDTISNAILDASLNDAEDCAKKLVCSLNAQDVNTLQADESAIAALFGKTAGGIDVTATTVEFDLAALMGRQAGKAQCDTIYARCPYQTKDLMEVMRKEL